MGIIKQRLNEINQLMKVQAAMPGHKGKIHLDLRHDITELPGADNLQQPKGIIQQAQQRAASVYGTEFARYLVNGSSSGNLTLIFSFFNEGDKIIVERNCHKSVFNGILLRKLKPIYLWPSIDDWGSSMPQSSQAVAEALSEHPDAKGVLLTLPSYKGLVSDYRAIYDATQRAGVKLLIDAAHGASLAGMEEFKDFYQSCDAMVISAHKSLACLNQGAMILGNCPSDQASILKYSNLFQTSSPSYLIMESMEESVEELARGRYLAPPDFSRAGYEVLQLNPATPEVRQDPWKLLICVQGQGSRMDSYLTQRGIFPEMHDSNSVLIMLSPHNGVSEVEYLRESLGELDQMLKTELEKTDISPQPLNGDISRRPFNIPTQRFMPWQIGDAYLEILLDQAIGATCQEQVVPYPPGVPILLPGEIIDESMVDHIKTLRSQNIEFIGLYDNKLRCIKEEEEWVY